MQEEIIARRKDNLVFAYLFCVILGIIFVATGICLCVFLSDNAVVFITSVCLMAVGLVLFVLCLVFLIKIFKTPEVIIRYENGKLQYRNLVFAPSEIKNVDIKLAYTKKGVIKWGKLIITLADVTLSIDFVEELEQVYNRLIQLITERET